VIIVDPKRKIPFTLRRFRDVPEQERPTLFARPMTASDYAMADEIWRAHDAAQTVSERIAIIDRWLTEKLAGWANMHLPNGSEAIFGTHAPKVVMCYGDLIEAATSVVNAADLSYEDRKKSLSPSASGAASSAGVVGGASPAAGKDA
jgi:hypothetical protein